MSIIQVLSIVYLIFTVVLLFKKRTTGKAYIYFGVLTYIFVIGYTSLPNIPFNIQSNLMFVVFSIMILLFGLMNGSIVFLIKKDYRVSQVVSVITSIFLILVIFNLKNMVSYIYIPVLLVIVQEKFNQGFKLQIN